MQSAVLLTFRFFWVFWVFWAAVYRWAAARAVAAHLGPEQEEHLAGTELARMLERLGATYVKFGQILSTRPDLIPPGVIAALSRLQDAVPPGPFSAIDETLSRELSATARARLVEIDETPIAAASVAQVHRGRLDTGEAVAVKVQRPEARTQIERDLILMGLGVRFLNLFPQLRPLSLPGALARFSKAMHDQLDFRLEAGNNRRFAASFAEIDGVEVPALHEDLCTAQVLTMELVEGVRATEPEKVGGHRTELARRGGEAVLKMVFEDGFVHADLHPGNILLTADGHFVLIDLGLVAEIPDDMLKPWCLTFMALAQRNGEELARLFYVYAPSVEDVDYYAFAGEIVEFFDGFYGKALGEVEVSVIVGGAMAVLRKHRVVIDPVYTVVNIAVLVAEGLGKQLDPSVDLVEMAFPYLVRAIACGPEGKPPLREIPEP
ncbi:MAG: hypothetical protein DRJ42_02895 [Deltaproteobacteria bacterium]|nr:MAG: hypothetical protein DRJ42_02895 [Deltaproteobacteria bacterium]